jgi:biotin carboxylase
MQPKTLILLGAGRENIHAITHAQRLGYRVLATDKNPKAVGAGVADEFLPLCAHTPEETVRGLLKWKENGGNPAGVLCVALDAPHTAAAVGKALGLPTVSEKTARLTTDKLAMKERFRERGIPIPWFCQVRDEDDVRRAIQEHGYPLVIKPVDSRGARGVLRLTDGVDLAWAYAVSEAESPTGRVMLEEYLDGPQISTEGLMIHGRAHIPGFSDRNYEFLERFAPHIIENGGDMPSSLPSEAQEAIKGLTGEAAMALGLEHGPVKGDMVWHDGKPYVIELAARHSGGYFVTHEIPWNTGVDLLGASMHMAMGETPSAEELAPRYQHGVCQRYFFPDPGQVAAVEGVDATAGIAEVRFVEVYVQPGDTVLPARNHPGRAGVLMTVAGTREQAQSAARRAMSLIDIQTTGTSPAGSC